MNITTTIDEIEAVLIYLVNASDKLDQIGKGSDHVFQARIEQFIRQIDTIGEELIEIDKELTHTEVREALTADYQYAYESIIYWQSKGHDLTEIAGWLETSVEVLIDLIDEFMELPQ